MSAPQQPQRAHQRTLLVFALFVFAALCLVFQALTWKVDSHPQFWLFLGLASLFAGFAVERAP